MKQTILVNIFSTLQSLEKVASQNRQMAQGYTSKMPSTSSSLDQQEQVLRKMRRTANRLQFEFVTNNWDAAVRLLNVFYGLNHMVRPEIMTSFASLVNKQKVTPMTRPEPVLYH